MRIMKFGNQPWIITFDGDLRHHENNPWHFNRHRGIITVDSYVSNPENYWEWLC